MDTEQLTDVLEDAGLSPYQAEAYVRLLELGTASATDVADASDVPDARIYDVLRDLDDHGYVEVFEQDTLRARAVDPAEVVADLTDRASRFEDAAEEITDRWQQPALDDHALSIVKRFETVMEAGREFIADADTQVVATLTPAQFEELRDDLAAAHERGITVNVTLLVGEDDPDPEEMSFEGVCTSVRRRPRPSPFIVTSDLQRTAFASNPVAVEEYGVVLDNRSFTYVFFWYFLSFMWLPWPVVHSGVRDRTPARYADVRQFMLEYDSLLADGATVEVEVEGLDIASGEPLTVSGPIVDAERVTERPQPVDSQLLELTGTATLLVEGDDGVYSVGGWSAIHEDVEARRITVTDVRPADGTDAEPAEDD
jgi:sugar-specific transcriptional regulator TrmB